MIASVVLAMSDKNTPLGVCDKVGIKAILQQTDLTFSQ